MVAYRYRNINPLISRELEMIMYTIIKSIAIAIPIGIMVAKTVEFVTQETNFTAMDLFLNWAYSIPSVLTAVITSIGVVFFIFLMIERYADTSKLEQFVYDPKTLPPLPKKVFRVSIFEIVFILSSSDIVPLATIRSKLVAIVAIPLSNDFSETSISLTVNPL